MKKFVKAALAVALVGFSSTLFAAQPISFLKDTTFGLFEDETVDNLAWGVEDADGLVLGGFNSSNYNFNIGAGAWLGSFWYSIYDTGTFYTEREKTETVTNDVVAKDGVNTDYVNTKKDSVKKRMTHNPELDPGDPNYYDYQDQIFNNLYLSFSTGDWGIQSYWNYSNFTNSDEAEYGKKTNYTEDKAAGTSRTTETNKSEFNGSNTFGAYFSGIGTDPDSDFYVQLNQFQVDWYNYTSKQKVSDTYKQNGVTYTGGNDNGTTYNTKDGKSAYSWNIITPYIEGEMGFALPDLGSMTSKFVLKEAFEMGMILANSTSSNNYVREDLNQKVTIKSSYKSNDEINIIWANILTPQFVFDFDVGERLSVKARAGVGITVSGQTDNKPSTGTNITETTTYNKYNKTTTKNYYKSVGVDNGGQLIKSFTTELAPTTDLALVYQVKPDKFNLNLGAEWNAGTFTWTTKTSTNKAVKTSTYSESTNTAGVKTVTQDDVNYVNKGDGTDPNDATPETRVTSFAAAPSAQTVLKIGATWFITEKASLDVTYTNGGFRNLSFWNGLLQSNLKIMFSVKF